MFSRIVVGVDGSPGSRAALRWGAAQAERHNAELVAVMAWQYPLTSLIPISTGVVPPVEAMDHASAVGLHQVIVDELGGDMVVLERTACSSPLKAIEACATDSTLIVLGRERRTVTEALFHRSTIHGLRRLGRHPLALISA